MDTVLCIKLDGYTSQICEAKYKNGNITVFKCSEFPLPNQCFEDNTILNLDMLISILKSEILRLGTTAKQVCFTIHNNPHLHHVIGMLNGKTPKQYVQQHPERFSTRKLTKDEQFMAYTVHDKFKSDGEEFTDMIVLFSTHKIIKTYNDIANVLGLELVGLANEGYSIANLMHEQILPNSMVVWLGSKYLNQFCTQKHLIMHSCTSINKWLKDIPYNNHDGLAELGYHRHIKNLCEFTGEQDTTGMDRDVLYNYRITDLTYTMIKEMIDAGYHLATDMTKTTIDYKHNVVRCATGTYLKTCISPKEFCFDNIYLFGILSQMDYLKQSMQLNYKIPVRDLQFKNIQVLDGSISANDIIGCACAANPNANMLNMPTYSNQSSSFLQKLFGKNG